MHRQRVGHDGPHQDVESMKDAVDQVDVSSLFSLVAEGTCCSLLNLGIKRKKG